jgi:gibberellin 20-oxidase
LKSENEDRSIVDYKSLQKPSEDLVERIKEELNVAIIDLEAIFNGDDVALGAAAEIVRETCMKHGVTNHGVDQNLINATYQEFVSLFKLPLSRKLNAMGSPWGYSCAHATRYSTSLPWKETFTFQYKHYDQSETQIVDFFTSLYF